MFARLCLIEPAAFIKPATGCCSQLLPGTFNYFCRLFLLHCSVSQVWRYQCSVTRNTSPFAVCMLTTLDQSIHPLHYLSSAQDYIMIFAVKTSADKLVQLLHAGGMWSACGSQQEFSALRRLPVSSMRPKQSWRGRGQLHRLARKRC